MPYYQYQCESCGAQHQQYFMVAEYQDQIDCECGNKAGRRYGANTASRAAWPMYSDAMGVHPQQVDEFHKDSVRRGVPTEFTRDGRAIFESASHRKRYCREYGFHDRNGGYGDP